MKLKKKDQVHCFHYKGNHKTSDVTAAMKGRITRAGAVCMLWCTGGSEPNKGYQAGLAKVPWKEHFQFVLNARSDAVQVKSKLFIEGRTMTRCLVRRRRR